MLKGLFDEFFPGDSKRLCPRAPPASLRIRQRGLAKQPWTDFLFNLPPKETGWDPPPPTLP